MCYCSRLANTLAQAQSSITLEEAKTAALAHAGLSEDQVRFSKQELDYDDGIAEYEIEIYVGNSAKSGKICKFHTIES